MPRGDVLDTPLTHDAVRVLTICNACRYCEGYCPVFPAIERRTSFTPIDLIYLANLCHNCGECLYACQYAPPHEFGVNIPRTLAQIRLVSYERYCWPNGLRVAFTRAGVVTSLLAAALFTLLIGAWTFAIRSSDAPAASGNFYAVLPHHTMVTLFGIVGTLLALALGVGLMRFQRDLTAMRATMADREPGRASRGWTARWRGLAEALTLTHLHPDGVDCTQGEEQRSPSRRWFHHLTSYGFGLCFASTCVAAIYQELFGWLPPYGYASAPVLLGLAGGIGLTIGAVGLLTLRRQRDREMTDRSQEGLDSAFILLLLLTAGSGLLLLALRATSAMSALLVIHLGCVLALFVSLPFGKFVHGLYRTAALIEDASERR
jgi:citrate/tricarballylate utilization protein